MTIDAWLQAAIADAERRGLPELKPLLEDARARDDGACARPTSTPRTRRAQRRASATAGRRCVMMTIEEFGRRLRAREIDGASRSPKSACGASTPTTRG